MHTLANKRIAIYARCATPMKIDRQIASARETVARAGGDAGAALVFSDDAVSGLDLDRPGLEALLRVVDERRVDTIVTEDVARISRDMAGLARVMDRVQEAGASLVTISDIDTDIDGTK
jgi:DNA invertase Pin-like site-specific DNA recombinase